MPQFLLGVSSDWAMPIAGGVLTCSGDVDMKTGGPFKMSRNTGMSFCRNLVYSAGTVCVNRSIESRSSPAAWSLVFTSITALHRQIRKRPPRGAPSRRHTYAAVGQFGGIDVRMGGACARHGRQSSGHQLHQMFLSTNRQM